MSRRACPIHVPLAPVPAAPSPPGAAGGGVAAATSTADCSNVGGGGGGGGGVGDGVGGAVGGGSFADRGAGGGDDGGGGLDEPGEEFWASADYCGFLRYSYEPGTMRRRVWVCVWVGARVRTCVLRIEVCK